MTPSQEEFLADWIIEEDTRGYPPSHARAREMASRVLRANGDTDSLGKRWISGFIQRNPRVASIVGKKMEACWIRKRLNVRNENMWNMDETGITLGIWSLLVLKKSYTYLCESPAGQKMSLCYWDNLGNWSQITMFDDFQGRKLVSSMIYNK